MPAKFESGVPKYVHGVALAEVYFPIDERGNAYCCCEQCRYYRENSRTCAQNKEVCNFPSKYVGTNCPMIRVTDAQYADLQELIIKIMEENDNESY